MIICTNCQYKNVSGAVFCAECGAQLDGVETLVTQAITDEQIEEELKKRSAAPTLPLFPRIAGSLYTLWIVARSCHSPPEMNSRSGVSAKVSRSCQILI